MAAIETLLGHGRSAAASVGVFVADVGRGLLEISHNALALLGLVIVAAALFAFGKADLRHQAEIMAFEWLQTRHEARAQLNGDVLTLVAEQDAVTRATAIDPKALPAPQASVTQWIARRYRVAPEPVARLVQEAWDIGRRAAIDPTLILAIIAVESSFNPFAQSPMGAQGLMQVLTKVHDDKYLAFGGNHAAFDPVSNLRVGVQVLKECIARAGSVTDGLRFYVGAAASETDGGYVGRVLAEQSHLRRVADGKGVPPNAPNVLPKEPATADVATVSFDGSEVALLR